MAESHTSLFWGDGEHDDENPQDFMNAVERSFFGRTTLTDTNKIRQFTLHLKAGSVAKLWLAGLPAAKKDTWEHLQESFEARWPEKPPPTRSSVEKIALLQAAKLSNEEMGKRVKVDGVEEQTHVVWAHKIQRLADAVPDTGGLLINSVRSTMPTVLKHYVTSEHTSWSAFCDAIRAVSFTQIEEEQAKVKATQKLEESVRRITEQGTPSKALGNAFRNVNLGAPIPAPRFNAPRPYTPQAPFTPPAPAYAQQRAPAFQTRSATDRMNDVHRLALPQHPDNPAGHLAYAAQVAAWTAANPLGKPNEFQPYPLTPGTSPVATRECWHCGYPGHMSTACNGTKVPAPEKHWRSIAATIKRNFDFESPANINYVAYEHGWTKEEYDRHIIQEFLLQGKAEGPST